MRIKITVWALLIIFPLSFLVGLSVIIILHGNQVSDGAITDKIEDNISYILLYSQLVMFLLLLIYSKQNGINILTTTVNGENRKKDIFFGSLLGLAIAFAYFKLGILEIITHFQKNIGDYVPPGETSTSVGKHAGVFFFANVILAPFVEENIYRNFAFKKFRKRMSALKTVLITSAFFGLLHWMGGFWYMLTTAILIGLPLGLIQLIRKNLLLVFTAHLSLNLMEYIFMFLK